MKPVVVGRYYVDTYISLFITTTLVNITSIDISEACISGFLFSYPDSKEYSLERPEQA